MDWTQTAGVALTSVVALAALMKYILDDKDRSQRDRDEALADKLDIHFGYQKEKFEYIGEALERTAHAQSEHAAQLANHDKRLAVLEVKVDR